MLARVRNGQYLMLISMVLRKNRGNFLALTSQIFSILDLMKTEQLRLEATMQSKIRVYESGRSEQDYDPDLPPELAAATGVQDVYAGRAIQVESGYGERLPSIDTRPPRIRDSDAIIEIVLQDSFCDSITSNGPLDQQPYQCEKQEFKGDNKVEDCDRAPDSEHFDRSPSYGGRKRENKKGSFMGSADSNVIEGNGILPSPSDVPMQYRSNSKSRSPIYAGDLQSASRAARWTKQSSREKYSHVNDHNPNDADARQNDKLPVDDDQKEKSEGSAEAKGSSQMSPTAPLETAGEVILEEGGSDQNDHPFLDDIAEIEDKETALNLPLSDETHGDIDSHHAVKKQKLTSRVEQPCFQGDGIDSRVTHSDDSRAKSGSSKDYMKRREGGEEEVVQRRRGKQTGDVERHHDEEKRNSSQRKDDHGRDGTHEIERSRIPSKGREDIPQFQQHQDMRSAHYERRGQGVERVKERDGSVGGRQRREDDAYGRRGKDEDAKRDQEKEIELRHKNKVMGTEKKGKDEDPHSRRHVDDGDWKGHHYRDGTTRQRDREDNLMSRREPLDDLHVKRRKDEEQRRREKVSKEDSQHGYRGREDGSHGKRERDDGADHRRREDQARVRDKSENHHSIRHRDENWRQREREDRLRFKQPREDTQKHKEREEGRSINRSGRVLEEKTTGGSGSRAADIYPPKDRRRHGDQHRRVDRGEEHTRPEHEVHEEMHTRDYQLSRKEKNSRHERLISHNDHSLTASDGEKVHRERSRKGKEIEVREPNIATGKRKLEDNVSNKSEKI
ncbi:hypothetical protein Taro_023839 [Colocasia esculenta]|uniref:Uncharacterized protein n=1 Tax=Colocasia esculenta TaxID=4460 RepID=A0A843V7L5_COLES|nr:hypothetical protein [Colocasia esculenta]